ncbi:MAG: hypothetical protein PHX72_03145 [Candidatus Shapirobacteria bacterium]|nr:hypothetical protein [Candidatus Shapirobacteria bacterium]
MIERLTADRGKQLKSEKEIIEDAINFLRTGNGADGAILDLPAPQIANEEEE